MHARLTAFGAQSAQNSKKAVLSELPATADLAALALYTLREVHWLIHSRARGACLGGWGASCLFRTHNTIIRWNKRNKGKASPMVGWAQSLGNAGAENNQKALWKRGLGASRGLHSLQQARQAIFMALVRKTGLEGTPDLLG